MCSPPGTGLCHLWVPVPLGKAALSQLRRAFVLLSVSEALHECLCPQQADPCSIKGTRDRDVWCCPSRPQRGDKAGTWHISTGDLSFSRSVLQLTDLIVGKVLVLHFSFLSLYANAVVTWVLAKSSLSR